MTISDIIYTLLKTDTFFNGFTVGVVLGIIIIETKNFFFKNQIVEQKSKSISKENEEFKMALLVRHDLKMGKGKVAAQCAAVSLSALNKSKLCGLPSKCARIVLRAPDLKTIECVQKQCKLFDIQTATFTENGQVTVLAIGPANETSINAQVKDLKLY